MSESQAAPLILGAKALTSAAAFLCIASRMLDHSNPRKYTRAISMTLMFAFIPQWPSVTCRFDQGLPRQWHVGAQLLCTGTNSSAPLYARSTLAMTSVM